MTARYDLMTARKGKDGKTYWTKVGVMFAMKDGKDGFNWRLEAYPIPKIYDGEVVVEGAAFPPKENDSGGGQQRQQRKPAPDLDEDIPF